MRTEREFLLDVRQWAPALDVQSELDALIAGKLKPKST